MLQRKSWQFPYPPGGATWLDPTTGLLGSVQPVVVGKTVVVDGPQHKTRLHAGHQEKGPNGRNLEEPRL
eukprot:10916426-Lingulodinium_polyedra.AAC.1